MRKLTSWLICRFSLKCVQGEQKWVHDEVALTFYECLYSGACSHPSSECSASAGRSSRELKSVIPCWSQCLRTDFFFQLIEHLILFIEVLELSVGFVLLRLSPLITRVDFRMLHLELIIFDFQTSEIIDDFVVVIFELWVARFQSGVGFFNRVVFFDEDIPVCFEGFELADVIFFLFEVTIRDLQL